MAETGTENAPTSGQLSAEELDALMEQLAEQQAESSAESAANRPFTGQEYVDDPQYSEGFFSGAIDRMETPITEEERSNPVISQVVESEEYRNATTSAERTNLLANAVNEYNSSIYNSRGELVMGGEGSTLDAISRTLNRGVPGGETRATGVRTEQMTRPVENPDFDPEMPEGPDNPRLIDATETFIVPKPGAESSWFQRNVAGGVLRGARELGAFVEDGLDYIGVGDPATNRVRENFPVYAPRDALDQGIQEVVAILSGGVGGAGLATKIDDVFRLGPRAAQWASRMWDDAKRIDPANAQRRFELAMRAFIAERGASIGATATTPEGTEPLVGDWALEQLGFDASENERVAHYIDNEAFAVGLNVLARGLGAGWRFGKRLVSGLSEDPNRRAIETGMLILKNIDSGNADVPAVVLAERARIMGEVMMNNREFRLGVLGQRIDEAGNVVDIIPGGSIELDSGTALLLGARDYAERAYAWRRSLMEPEAYERMLDDVANEVAENIVGLRQGMRNERVVREGDNAILRDTSNVLQENANAYASPEMANAGAQQLATDVATPVIEARRTLDAASRALDNARTTGQQAYDRDAVMRALDVARQNNALGSDAAERQILEQLTGPDLLKAWEDARTAYSDAFDAIEEGIDFDRQGLRDLVTELADETNQFSTVTVREMEADPFRLLLDGMSAQQKRDPDTGRLLFDTVDGERVPVMETVDDVMARIEGDLDLKFIYTDLRPAISRRMDLLQSRNMPIPASLTRLKQFIDDAAEQSGDPAFREAMDLYEDYASTFLRTEPLRQYDTTARQVADEFEVRPGERIGELDAYEAGMRALNASENAQSSQYITAFIDALNRGQGGNVTDEMAQAYMGMALNNLARSTRRGDTVSAEQIRTAVAPYLDQLRATNSEAVSSFENAVQTIEMAQMGLANAEEAERVARAAYDQILTEAREDAASVFIRNLDGANPSPLEDTATQWSQIFNAADAPERVEELMRRAASTGNQLAIDGIKSRYLAYIRDRIFTQGRRGADVTADGTAAVREVSPTQLTNMLEGAGDNTLTTLRRVFSDEPERAVALERLFEVLNISVNNRAMRGNNFGSTTVYDGDLKRTVDRLIVLTLGVLNPVATKARNLSAVLVEGRQQQIVEAIQTNFALMVTSPSYFNEVMQAVASDLTDESLTRLITPYIARATFGAAKDGDSSVPQNYQAVEPEE